jgi:uncharacterized protein involved in exopolysaccharide biosynthesis
MLDDSKHATIPAIYEGPRYVARPIAATTYTATPEPEAGPATVPLAHYLWILRRRGWQLASFVGVCVAATLLISLRLTPVYEATAIVDIDRQTPPGIIGQDATRTEVNDADQFIATQVKLIQSDSVLRPIVDKYRLREVEEITVDKNVRRVDAEDAPVVLKKLKISRPPNLPASDQLPFDGPETVGQRGQRHRAQLYRAYFQSALQGLGESIRVHGETD